MVETKKSIGYEVYCPVTGQRIWVCKLEASAKKLVANFNDGSCIQHRALSIRIIPYTWKN